MSALQHPFFPPADILDAMDAYILDDFSKPPALRDVPDPQPGPGEVVVRVISSSINPVDAAIAAGYLRGLMEHKLPLTMGRDVAGIVERVGRGVSRLSPGDEALGFVFGPVLRYGTWAARALLPERVLARKPARLTWTDAGALPLAGAAADGVIRAASLDPGDTLLINGAAGGVGGFAIQLAAARGAHVIATGRPDDAERLRALGARDVLEPRRGDVPSRVKALVPNGLDALIDLVSGGDELARATALVRAGGRVATTLGAADVGALAQRGITATNVMASDDAATMERLADLAASGALRVPIGGRYALDTIDAGFAALHAGARGKLALGVGRA